MSFKKFLSTVIAAFISITAIPFNAVSADSESKILVWDGTTDTSWYDSEDTEFHISTAKEFAGLATLVNSGNTMKDKTIILDNDIYMNDISNFESWSGSSSSIKHKYGYSKIENSTSVITIKAVDRVNSRIEHSCDIAIVYNCGNGQQQYIRCYKGWRLSYRWEYRDKAYDIDEKLQWIEENRLKQQLRDQYLINKSRNNNPEKHSRTIFAETVNNIYNEYHNRRK